MDLVQQFIAEAKRHRQSVVLPEGSDARVIAAARRLLDDEIAEPIVLGTSAEVEQAAAQAGVALRGIRTIDPSAGEQFESYTAAYAKSRGLKESVSKRMVARNAFYGGMMVRQGDAHTMVAGVCTATANVIQAGALTVGYAPGITTASSFFLMILPEFRGMKDCPLVFADCAVNIAPTPEQLADTALASAASAGKLLGEEPRVAMLSFSTQGSASHAEVDKVNRALEVIRQRSSNVQIDGEFQADAALMPQVAAKKIKRPSAVAGKANVLVFPDLNSGNIGYKLTQYLAGARAIGPFLQGFAKPISDLSRGASVDDIVATVAVCLAQTQEAAKA
jgi:phosphate acetyltransferase